MSEIKISLPVGIDVPTSRQYGTPDAILTQLSRNGERISGDEAPDMESDLCQNHGTSAVHHGHESIVRKETMH